MNDDVKIKCFCVGECEETRAGVNVTAGTLNYAPVSLFKGVFEGGGWADSWKNVENSKLYHFPRLS